MRVAFGTREVSGHFNQPCDQMYSRIPKWSKWISGLDSANFLFARAGAMLKTAPERW
jgi:hypothetical protein